MTIYFKIANFVLFCYLFLFLGGCATSSQEKTMDLWNKTVFNTTEQHVKNKPFSANELLKVLGEPDYKIKGSELSKIVPNKSDLSNILKQIKAQLPETEHALQKEKRQELDDVFQNTFWFYDESARYAYPASPSTFWNMGTGFKVIWFVVDSKNLIITSGSLVIGNHSSPFKKQQKQ